MTEDLRERALDNPAWHALNGAHSGLAVAGQGALRYLPAVAPFASVSDPEAGIGALRTVLAGGDTVVALTLAPAVAPPGLEIVRSAVLVQLLARDFRPVELTAETVELTAGDVPAMLELTELTRPGPFGPRTIEMGRYIGIRQHGQLLAMAGERMRLDGFCEVSAVCTHPDHRGRGYARQLVAAVAGPILARGELPFLHAYPDNAAALATYGHLGFVPRRDLHMSLLRLEGTTG